MKWLILSNSPYLNGGFQTLTKELSRAVVENGGSVQFLCFQANPYLELAEEYPGKCAFPEAPAINTRSVRPAHLWRAYRTLRKLKPDVLFLCNSGTPDFLPFMVVARLAGVSHVVVHHGTDVQLPDSVPSRRYCFGLVPGLGLWKRELVAAMRFAFRSVSVALFNNLPQLESWQRTVRMPSAKCALWYPPMEVSRFQRSVEARERVRSALGVEGRFVIGGVGHLNRQKSFDVAIRALADAGERLKDGVLVIAGEGAERQNLEALIRHLRLEGRVLLLGDRSDIPDLMNAFDIFCLPSTQLNETLGIVILEAMATRVPVVVTDLPGPSRLAGMNERALVVPRGDAAALADAWITLSSRVELRERLVTSAFELTRRCDRKSVLRDIYRELGVHAGDPTAAAGIV